MSVAGQASGPRPGPTELAGLAASIATQPHLWEDKVAYSDEELVFASLHRDANVDVWLICWTPVNDAGWHDHDVSSGAVAVARGKLVEHNLAIGTESIETEVEAGDVYGFGPDHIHRLTGLVKGSVTVHAYSPPLWRMGQCVSRRVSINRSATSRSSVLVGAERIRHDTVEAQHTDGSGHRRERDVEHTANP